MNLFGFQKRKNYFQFRKRYGNIPKRKRVAAYCRVSALQEMQHHSLEAQKEYYERLILENTGWIFVGIYADEASGRHNAKMHNFQKMLQDCREKKINFILIKSISRMGRNTLKFLKTCDEFSRLGVEVFFEVEKLYISNPEAVRILTIYASVYQNESEEKSDNISGGIRTIFASGTSAFASRPCYGYTKSAEGLLTPDLETSEVVKLIYELHNAGFSLRKISTELYDMKIPSPRGKSTQRIETIRRILTNEKYCGNVILQKIFVSDYFTGKQSINKGELPQYLIKNNHDAIIKYNFA